MPLPKVFIAYDFEIHKGLPDDFAYAKSKLASTLTVDWPASTQAAKQGEIWRNVVRPALEDASQFIAYLDLPNANVGFEIGYALGHCEGKKAALVRTGPKLPNWLRAPPLNGFACPQMSNGEDLVNQLKSDSWITLPKRPVTAHEIFLVYPPKMGRNYIEEIRKKFPDLKTLPEAGWSLNDLPDRLQGVGACVWLILPHR